MTLMTNELVIDFADLGRLDIQCAGCGTRILFDISNEQQRTPVRCPGCEVPFDLNSVQIPLVNYRNAWKALTPLRHKLRVRVDFPSTQD
jgi:hypothetical protein